MYLKKGIFAREASVGLKYFNKKFMCGFVGYSLFNKIYDFDPETILQYMSSQILHRGPDERRILFTDNFGVAFNRLSIVDIESGSQPIYNENKSIGIVVNGEIYNYKLLYKLLNSNHTFRSNSDCEVLVHLYEEKGESFLDYINGMFSIALWDSNNCTLILARDRLGIKPLYYSYNKDRLLFGSEIKALLPFPDCPREFDWTAALNTEKKVLVRDDYKVETYFKGIEQLRGGEYLILNTHTQNVKIKKYWNAFFENAPVIQSKKSVNQIIGTYREILEDSVSLMLPSDVEAGLFLSGGIDSASIAALARKSGIKTFTVLNEDTIENEDALYARKVADILKLENYQIITAYDEKIHDANFWKNLVWQCETYECGTEQLFKYELHRYIKNKFPKIKVVLLGQGSDEFNGGYSHKYLNEDFPNNNNRWEEFIKVFKGINHTIYDSDYNKLSYYSSFLNDEYLRKISLVPRNITPWRNYMITHSKNLQLYQLLHEDRTAMANNIENRVPFLDHRLVELLINAPEINQHELFWNKNILRKAVNDVLPLEICNRPKVPFIFDNKNNYSEKIILSLLTRDDNHLINYAFGDYGQAHEVINRKQINNALKQATEMKNYSSLETVKQLVNMGILAKKVKEEYIVDKNFYENNSKISVGLNISTNKIDIINYIDKCLPKQKIDENTVYMVDSNTILLTDNKGTWYVFINDEAISILTEEHDNHMISIIKTLNERSKSFSSILNELEDKDVNPDSIRSILKRLMEEGIVTTSYELPPNMVS